MTRKKATAKRKTVKRKVAKRKTGAQNSVKKKVKRGKGKPFKKGNEHRFPPGQSGNPGGRPKLLTGAYTKMLAEVDGETGMTKAEMIARAGFVRSVSVLPGGTAAAREIRQATEGDTVNYKFDVSLLTDEQLRRLADGDDPATVLTG